VFKATLLNPKTISSASIIFLFFLSQFFVFF
jgi:hypothetical protein